MKLKKWLVVLSLALILFGITSCGAKKNAQDLRKTETPHVRETMAAQASAQPAQLPVRYQSTGFVTSKGMTDDDLGEGADEYQIKVGATIRSSGGPQPLWDVMKRLANLKGMTVSWASDVDGSRLVDVDISANDNFFDALANLLRQADYYHEIKGKTIVVLNKETKVYQIGVPAMKGGYTSTVGGNFLANKDAASGTEGTIKIASADNKFDVWENIEKNLTILLGVVESGGERVRTASTTTANDKASESGTVNPKEGNGNVDPSGNARTAGESGEAGAQSSEKTVKNSRQTADDGAYFVIDKSVGLITVTAKPVVLKKVENYLNTLRKQLYQQVSLEAKIIEVFLQDNSKIGLDWSAVLKDFPITGTTSFGNNGQVYPHLPGDNNFANTFVSRVDMDPLNFRVLLNALNEQGDARVLANPKITVLNGQPAIISVGKDIAYVKSVTKTSTTGVNQVDTFTAEVDNVVQGVALGVMASILDGKKVILHLTPLTTDIDNLDAATGGVALTSIGDGSIQLGLPQVRIREMSTMVQVEDGEMLIIGGLIDSKENNTGDFAPGLGSIPVVKYLFGVEEKQLQKRELVILLTPKII